MPVLNYSAAGIQTGHLEEETQKIDKGQACEDRGQLFDTVHDVQRHVKTVGVHNRESRRNENMMT